MSLSGIPIPAFPEGGGRRSAVIPVGSDTRPKCPNDDRQGFGLNGKSSELRLGYACSWWHPREQTWSYSATRLRQALDAHADVDDIEAQRSLVGKVALR